MNLNIKAALRALTQSDTTFNSFISILRGSVDTSPYNRQQLARLYETNAEVRTLIDYYVDGFQSIPIRLVDRNGMVVTDDYRLDLINDPNAFQTQKEFEGNWAREYGIFDEVFILASRNTEGLERFRGQVNSMRVLPSKLTDFRLESQTGRIIGYTNSFLSAVNIPVLDVLPTFGPVVSPEISHHATPKLVAASKLIKKIEQIHDSEISSIANHGVSALVTRDEELGKLTEKQKKNINNELNNINNSNQVRIIDGRVNVHDIARTPVDLGTQLASSAAFKALALVMRIPIPLISDDASTFNNVENARRIYVKNVLIPDKQLYCEKLTEFLDGDADGLRFEVDLDAIEEIQNIPTAKINALDIAKASINDRLEALGLDRIDDRRFDQPVLKANDRFADQLLGTNTSQ